MTSTQIHIPLTAFDHAVPRAYYNGAFYLSLKSGVTADEAFKLLHEGLHRTFIKVPWLSGKVHMQSPETPGWRPGQAEIRHDPVDINREWPHQLKFKALDTDASYEELKDLGFPTDAFRDDELVWSPFFSPIETSPEIFVAQANFIPGCCIITAAIHHAASDETAFINVLKLWSDNCATLQKKSKALVGMPPGSSDRDIVENLWAKEETKPLADINPRTWMLVGLAPTDVQQDPMAPAAAPAQPPVPAKPQRVLKAGVFYISPSNFTDLQKSISKELGVASGVSGNDAICALVWRCFMRARLTARKNAGSISPDDADDAPAGLNMVCDGRPDFSSGISPSYLGNITFNIGSRLPLQKLTSLDEGSIATAAAMIRKGAGSIESENLLDLYTLLKNLPDFDHLSRWKRNRTASLDGNNMSISSMIMFPLASVCFGDGVFGNRGMPEAVRPLMEGCNRYTRICFILPRNRNGGIEFVANLFDEEMDVLMEDEEFAKYASCLCWS